MKNILSFLAIGIIFVSNIFASNTEDPVCTGTVSVNGITAQSGGLYKPSSNGANEYFKALIVFVQFDNTTKDPNNTSWEIDEMPVWANDIIDSSPSSSYSEFTLSDYWKTMSLGSFDFIGDVYPNLVVINSESYYENNNYKFGKCNRDALTQIDPFVDFSDYDNWSYNSSTSSFEFTPDGYVDQLIMIYRDPVNNGKWFNDGEGNFSAIAVLSGSSNTYNLNFDGVTVRMKRELSVYNSGITVAKGLKGQINLIPIIAHEYGHSLYGANHNAKEGLMHDPANFVMTAWEREKLGYLSYLNCNQNNFTVTLSDFIEDGDVLRIPIPITNQSSSTYFIVENHQRSSNYDQVIRGGSLQGGYNFNTDVGKGIYIWLIRNGGSSSTHSSVSYEAITADGRWDWLYEGDYYAGPGWYVGKSYEGYLPKTTRQYVDRDNGLTDREPEHIYWNSHMASKWVDKNLITNQYELTRNVMGDEKDAYNFNYVTQFTPWSNPSSYVNGATNISIQLYNQSGGDITIKTYTTASSGQNLPPSNPQNLKVAWYNDHPKLTWETNTEPDMQLYAISKMIESQTGWANVGTVTHNSSLSEHSWIDNNVTKPGKFDPEYSIYYKVKAKDTQNKYSLYSDERKIDGYTNYIWKMNNENDEESDILVTEYSLEQNYPNPFNPTTQISYQIPDNEFVSLKVYNSLGQEVRTLVNNYQSSGYYNINFDGSELSSGIYFYRLTASNYVETKKMLLTK